ncbi:MAG: ATP-dependent zinc metalloprotease FtsH [Pseudomonadota bacterium]|jgi:cell division protease FtsH|uniref:ATP-dependent zinc metalloprotease FtsH n=1 Tax=Qipengyuania pacifica TaxID=2860199 RepID=UPI000C0E71F6|nr:ATP-dependent zinc metalloprotease FtsH [Qipengyuania pacifica]MAG40792.1 cell division protein FtsH [Erythrobacteraceae bacterium]MCH2498292.1 ATP-dependent zinc metalloprotease FtsH [Erythrobacter sp.]MEE2794152.1 ATP-dependent zinc metalloprotease FtsH [Pseudomonadota bacterium]QPL40939.1 ATP-dependent zinc metalloprotease FtsH [Erythrobacter sp. A30-3]MBY8333859.1 ATP-dependent zinc metalloprotease FtsH [Qipengyuania pacifica]|tara:strand:- start:1438 stop:3396 length:1959 start_codon:yes stop_codon:yes gene_type:complete
MSEQNSPPEPEGNGPNPWVKSLMIWGGIFLALLMVVSFFGGSSSGNGTQLLYSDFRDKVAEGSVANVQISETQIVGEMKNGEQFSTIPVANDTSLPQLLEDNGVRYSGAEADNGNILLYALIQILPFVLILGIAFFALRQVQKGGGAGGAMGFGKSKAKLLTERQGKVTFDDVAGIDEAREELEEIVEFLKDPQRFSKLGGQIPKGALLVGSPGTGKTLLARAIAGEAGVPFFTISGSDFVEMFVGVGASRVRDMFEQAKKNAPCILFIDEIDAVGRSRGHGLGNSNDEREQTLNQLLVEMDGFEANEGIIIIAATNRPDVLDPALLRPGRFDRQVVVPVPDIDGREKILAVHMKKLPLAPDVNPRTIARGTPGFSGADLANLCNEAALLAARRNKRLVAMQEFEDAKDKVMMGAERRSMVMTEDEKKMTAYHEAGHALVSLNEPASDPIHKATIIPRGRALGMVMRLPERDSYSYHRDKMHANLAVAMGGRVAEEIIFGHDKVSSGASGDIQYATDLARNMVTKWGMSDKLGPLQYEQSQEGYLGMGQTARTMGGAETNKLIDAEIKDLVENGLKRATEILTDQEDKLHLLAQAMLEYETLTGEEIDQLMKDGKIDRPDEPKSSVTIKPLAGAAVPKAGRKFGGGTAPQGA